MNARAVRIAVFMLVALPLFLGIVSQREQIPITTSSNEARTLIQTAVGLMDALRFNDARDQLMKAVSIDPDCAYGYLCLSVCATNPADSRMQINKALKLVTHVSDGERMLIQAVEAQMNGNVATSEAILHKLVNQYPGDVRAHVTYGSVLYAMNRYTDAIKQFEKAIDIDRTFAPAYNMLGYAQIRNNNLGEAETAFKHYTTLIPNEPNPHDSYAELLLKEGKYDEAIDRYARAISLDPQFYSSHIGMSTAYLFKGMPVEARKHLQEVYDNAPDNGTKIEALNFIAGTYIHEGRFDQALEQLNKAHTLAVSMQDPVLIAEELNNIGRTLLEASTTDLSRGTYLKTRIPETVKIDQASVYFDDAGRTIKNSDLPEDAKAISEVVVLVNKIEVSLLKNDLAGAKILATRLDDQTRNNREMVVNRYRHQVRAMIAMAEKRFDGSITELQQANLLNPLNLWRLSEAYEGAGNTARAKEIRDQIWNYNENSFTLAFVRPLSKP